MINYNNFQWCWRTVCKMSSPVLETLNGIRMNFASPSTKFHFKLLYQSSNTIYVFEMSSLSDTDIIGSHDQREGSGKLVGQIVKKVLESSRPYISMWELTDWIDKLQYRKKKKHKNIPLIPHNICYIFPFSFSEFFLFLLFVLFLSKACMKEMRGRGVMQVFYSKKVKMTRKKKQNHDYDHSSSPWQCQ